MIVEELTLMLCELPVPATAWFVSVELLALADAPLAEYLPFLSLAALYVLSVAQVEINSKMR